MIYILEIIEVISIYIEHYGKLRAQGKKRIHIFTGLGYERISVPQTHIAVYHGQHSAYMYGGILARYLKNFAYHSGGGGFSVRAGNGYTVLIGL